jgi:hypothetical protein
LTYNRPSSVETTPETVATLSDAEQHTLTSCGNAMKFVGGKSLSAGQFGASGANMGSAKLFYFYKLYDANGATATAYKYETTASTMLEIWKQGVLMIKTALKDWGESSYSSSDIQARISGYGPITIDGESLSSSYNYGVIISGLKKIPTNAREAIEKKIESSKQNKEAKK